MLQPAKEKGIRQMATASSSAVASPKAEEIIPLFRKPPIKTSTTTRGIAATTAETIGEDSGATGCGHTITVVRLLKGKLRIKSVLDARYSYALAAFSRSRSDAVNFNSAAF